MSQPRNCPNCGRVLANDAPDRLCELCLMERVLNAAGSDSDRDDSDNDSEATLDFDPGTSEVLKFLAPSTTPKNLGTLNGLEVIGVLGRGAMGIVLDAYDPNLSRPVAIKVLAPHNASQDIAKSRFLTEGRSLAQVTAANVVTIYDVGDEPFPYIVMERLSGPSIAQLIASEGQLDEKTIVDVGRQVAAGLAAIHESKLIHRDIKPSNLLLTGGETVKITDFGLVRDVEKPGGTKHGVVLGTPQYMAPEQSRGEDIDGRADLFSLGCVLYEMASGVSPFRGDDPVAELRNVREKTPVGLTTLRPDLSAGFASTIHGLLAKNAAHRPPFASTLAKDLDRYYREGIEPSNRLGLTRSRLVESIVNLRDSNLIWLPPVLLFSIGLFMMVLSSIVGVDDIVYRRPDGSDQQVGYLGCVNWTVTFTLLVPLLATGIILIIKQSDRLIEALQIHRMFFSRIRGEFVRHSYEMIGSWNACLRPAVITWVVTSVLGFLVCMHEWYTNSLWPLMHFQDMQTLLDHNRTSGKDVIEIDWSVAHFVKEDVSKLATGVFSFLAFTMQSIAASMILLFAFVSVAFGAFIAKHAWWSDVQLLPQLQSSDPRLGFERLENPGTLLMTTGVGYYLLFYLTVLHNVYLTSNHANVFQMIGEPLEWILRGDGLRLLSEPILVNYSTMFALMSGLSIVVVVIALVPGLFLTWAAKQAKSNTLDLPKRYLSDHKFVKLFGMSPQDAEKHLSTMQVWPYRYLTVNSLLIAVFLCLVGLIWFRLMPFLFVVILIVLGYRYTKVMRAAETEMQVSRKA